MKSDATSITGWRMNRIMLVACLMDFNTLIFIQHQTHSFWALHRIFEAGYLNRLFFRRLTNMENNSGVVIIFPTITDELC
ncbi:CLUMA_CG000937, isoform A [Clunio marinus]|uniref:CLUMA_CG000937, isoform A n=1 Tax=Clunio marinus TaxID=568069 RepID=A0A1J1HGI2_9DIPT|nr:CLUMA_CG000937, isoform A [Clunio marinus]